MEFENVPQLLIFAPNWLGDAVMALPAIADVRRALPNATLDVFARPSIAPLFRLVPGLDGIVSGDVPRQKYAAALLLTNSFQTALAAMRAGVAERWGYRADWRAGLLTRAVLPPPDTLHQAASYQHLTRTLGFPSGPLEPKLVADDEARRKGRELLVSSGWDGVTPLVALAPGAAYGGAKRWPESSFAELALSLSRDGVRTAIIGSASDAVQAKGFQSADPINLVGRTDLRTLAGVLLECRALVSNDSGAMHFAAALGVAVVAMFGPTDQRVTRPIAREGGSAIVLTHDVWCRPCLQRECPLTHRCMRRIRVETVIETVRKAL